MKKLLWLSVLFLCLAVNSCAKKQTVAPEDESDQDLYEEQTEQATDLDVALLEPEEFSQEPSTQKIPEWK